MRISDPPVTLVQRIEEGARRRRFWTLAPLALLLAVAFVLAAANLWRLHVDEPVRYANIGDHFKYGSIGGEAESGLPYWMWRALPILFANELGPDGLSVFGFLYEEGRDLPIGVSRRDYRGVELAWLNCAACHAGTYTGEDGERHIVLGMPANNFDLQGFLRLLFDAAADGRLTPARVMAGMRDAGADFGPVDWALYRLYVLPRVLAGLRQRHATLGALMHEQVRWGPGRIDTFNPYKLTRKGMRLDDLDPLERHGVADLPSVFLQRPRAEQGMRFHWDGSAASLREHNLFAAIGVGAAPESIDRVAVERVAEWLLDLRPPPSPYAVDAPLATRGRAIYMRDCAACHGYQDAGGYVFRGDALGRVTAIEDVGTDRGRLDSYTQALGDLQASIRLEGEPGFSHFEKTGGYANLPLDGLWLRAPYLHNGSVPTLRDLLRVPSARPVAFERGGDRIDPVNGGFQAEICDPEVYYGPLSCFDARQSDSQPDNGNGNGGHLFGTALPPDEKQALLEYLKTF